MEEKELGIQIYLEKQVGFSRPAVHRGNSWFCTAVFQSMGFLSCGQPFLRKEVNVSMTPNKDVAFNSLLFRSLVSNAQAEVSDFLIVVQKSEVFQYFYILCTLWANTKKHFDKRWYLELQGIADTVVKTCS